MADTGTKLDLDARQYIEVTLETKEYKVFAPPLSRAPELARIGKLIQEGSEAVKDSDPERVKELVDSVADYIELHTAEIPREAILRLDLGRALKFLKATQELLPKGVASPAPGAS